MTKSLGRDRARRCASLDEWPQTDRALWLAALEAGDLLEPGGARAQYRAASNHKVVSSYGRWIAWLDFTGQLDPSVPPGLRITRPLVQRWLGELQGVNGRMTVLSRIEDLYQAATVMDPPADWSWLRRLASRVRSVPGREREKRSRMVAADELFAFGCGQMADAHGTARQRAIRYRDGLLIALLAARPLRRRNLAGLTIGTNVVPRGDAWWIVVDEADTKNATPLEMPWPRDLMPMLEIWLAVHRPILAGFHGRWHKPAGDAFWLSADGSPMTEMAIYDRIVAVTASGLGKRVNPHLFRDCVATSIAIEDPARIGIAGQILGHRARGTVERFYNQAQSLEAARQLQATLLRLRDPPNQGSVLDKERV